MHRDKTVIYRSQGEVVVMIAGSISGMYDEFGCESYLFISIQPSSLSPSPFNADLR
jgi:hypothetical protein